MMGEEEMKIKKYSVTFRVQTPINGKNTAEALEVYLKDLLTSSVLPALNLELIPLTLEVKKARK